MALKNRQTFAELANSRFSDLTKEIIAGEIGVYRNIGKTYGVFLLRDNTYEARAGEWSCSSVTLADAVRAYSHQERVLAVTGAPDMSKMTASVGPVEAEVIYKDKDGAFYTREQLTEVVKRYQRELSKLDRMMDAAGQ